MRLHPVLTWLLGVRKVAAPRPTGVPAPVISEWTPPKPRTASATEQALAIIGSLQEEGLTGVIPRQEILDRYKEHCWMLGFRPISTNALCEALGQLCNKPRIMLGGKKVTAYLIPEPVRPRVALAVIPNGNVEALPWPELPERARTGTSHAQA